MKEPSVLCHEMNSLSTISASKIKWKVQHLFYLNISQQLRNLFHLSLDLTYLRHKVCRISMYAGIERHKIGVHSFRCSLKFNVQLSAKLVLIKFTWNNAFNCMRENSIFKRPVLFYFYNNSTYHIATLRKQTSVHKTFQIVKSLILNFQRANKGLFLVHRPN